MPSSSSAAVRLLLGFAPPERVFALKRRDGLDGVRAANRLHACFGQSEMLHFAGLDQFLDRARNVFDGHIGIDAVLVEQIDEVGLETLERGVGDFADVVRPAVETALSALDPDFESKLGGDDDVLAKRRERLADQVFVRVWPVNFGGIEERHPRSTAARMSLMPPACRWAGHSPGSDPCNRARGLTRRDCCFRVCVSAWLLLWKRRDAELSDEASLRMNVCPDQRTVCGRRRYYLLQPVIRG